MAGLWTAMHYSRKRQLNVYRVFGFIGAPAVVYGQLTTVVTDSSLSVLALAAFVAYLAINLGGCLATFFSEWARQNIDSIAIAACACLVLYSGAWIHLTGLSNEQAFATFALVPLASLMWPRLIHVWVWSIGTAIVLSGFAGAVSEPVYPLGGYLIMLWLASIFGGTVRSVMLRSAEAAAESNALIKSVFDNATDGLLYGEVHSAKVVGANDRVLSMFETDDPSIAATQAQVSFFRVHGATTPQTQRDLVRRALAQGAYEEDLEFQTAQGNTFYGRLAMARIGRSGRSMMIRITDISDLHERELEISRARDLAEAFFTQSADALVYGDLAKSSLSDANPRARALLETDDLQIISNLLKQAFVDANPDEDPSSLIQRVLSEPVWEQEVSFRSASGREFYGRLAMITLRSIDPNMAMIRVTDLSDMHARQKELVEAKEAAEAAIEVRSQFLANMSHEIRTPMNGVIGMTSLLLNTNLSKEQSSYVETIRSSGESLLTIINEILDFSKIEAGQIELEHQEFDLEQCLADALDIVTPMAAQKHLEVILNLAPIDARIVRGDVQRLRQVLVNILSNAIKFTHHGEVSLGVHVEGIEEARSDGSQRCQLSFAIADTGIGIPAFKLQHLFDAFTQADASTTRRYGGTGLGLSISRSLAQLMGGDIRVDSVQGNGSTFTVDVVADCLPARNLPHVGDLQGRRVLAVDDNQTNREVLSGLLHWQDLDSKVFATPAELLRAIERGAPELIISDMAMPDMDGAALAREIAERLENPPPIILLTSLDRGEVDWSQFATVLRKPVRPSDLFFAIHSALAGTERTESANINFRPHAPAPLQDQCVLVAEDNVVNQTVARQMLKKLGLRADTAANGREAVEMMTRRDYSLVFMDVQMPEIDGLEATRLIRLEDSVAQPWIVAMTANARPEDREACLDAGMDDFVGKPIRLQDVQHALERAVTAGMKGGPH